MQRAIACTKRQYIIEGASKRPARAPENASLAARFARLARSKSALPSAWLVRKAMP